MTFPRLVTMMFLLISCAERKPAAPAAPVAAPSRGGQGTDVGGGIERQEVPTAWFQGEGRAVRACIRATPSLAGETLRRSVERSWAKWADYVASRGVHARLPAESRLSTTLRVLDDCPGDEDLLFLFGTGEEDPAVRGYLKGFRRPLAVAQRRGKGGFIWLAPDHRPGDRDAILLHEIGHVFGNGHVEGTIMDGDLFERLRSGPGAGSVLGARIDHHRELYEGERSFWEAVVSVEDPAVPQFLYPSVPLAEPDSIPPETRPRRISVTLERAGGWWKSLALRDDRGLRRELSVEYASSDTELLMSGDPHTAFHVEYGGGIRKLSSERYSLTFKVPLPAFRGSGGRVHIHGSRLSRMGDGYVTCFRGGAEDLCLELRRRPADPR